VSTQFTILTQLDRHYVEINLHWVVAWIPSVLTTSYTARRLQPTSRHTVSFPTKHSKCRQWRIQDLLEGAKNEGPRQRGCRGTDPCCEIWGRRGKSRDVVEWWSERSWWRNTSITSGYNFWNVHQILCGWLRYLYSFGHFINLLLIIIIYLLLIIYLLI